MLITFDLWATIVLPQDEVAATAVTWLDVLRERSFTITSEALSEQLNDAWRHLIAAWRSGRYLDIEWLVDQVLADLFATDSRDITDDLRQQLRNSAGVSSLAVARGATELLASIKDRHTTLGLISDTGLTPSAVVRQILDDAGILYYFDVLAFSDELRVRKPATTAFYEAAALAGGLAGYACVHVGDSRWADVGGARAAGWRTIRYAGIKDDTSDHPDADYVARSYSELRDYLNRMSI